MKKASFIIFLLFTLILSGCGKMEQNVTINEDGSIDLEVISLALEEIAGDAEYSDDSNYVFTTYEDIKFSDDTGNYIGKRGVVTYDSFEEFSSNSEENIDFVKTILPNGNVKIEYIVLKGESEVDLTSSGEELEVGELPTVIYSLTVPYEVVENNADEVEGNSYIWDLMKETEDSLYLIYNPKVKSTTTETKTPIEFSTYIREIPDSGFKDMINHWASENVNSLYDKGAINGYPDGNFKPSNIITRAEFLSIVVSMASGETFYNDERLWYSEVYEYSDEKGIIDPWEMSIYDMDKPINRYEMVEILVKSYENIQGKTFDWVIENDDLLDFEAVPDKYKRYVVAGYNTGAVSGFPNGKFEGHLTGTRAQAAAMIDNFFK